MNKHQVLYDYQLANEWIDYVEAENPKGSREKELYELIGNWAKATKAKRVVDIGCGQGICSASINKDVEYIGIDQSEILLKRAQNNYKSANRQFVLGDAYKIPLEDNFTDAAISIWVWSHLENLEQAAREMYRVLKPGGRFLIITANPDTYDIRRTFYKSFKDFGDHLVGIFDLGSGKVLTDTTLYFHTREKMMDALKKSKLRIDKVEVIGLEETYSGGLNILIEGHKV